MFAELLVECKHLPSAAGLLRCNISRHPTPISRVRPSVGAGKHAAAETRYKETGCRMSWRRWLRFGWSQNTISSKHVRYEGWKVKLAKTCKGATGHQAPNSFLVLWTTVALTLIVRGSQLHIWVRGGADSAPPLVNAVLMAQTSWNFVCDLTWVVSERFHDQRGTIMCQAPGWVQDPKIQKFQEFWNSDIFFIFFVQNWLPRTQRPFPLNSWWKNGPFWCKNHCSSSKTVDFSIFSGGARKKIGLLGGPP